MKREKILIILFTASLVLPNLIYAAFYSHFDTENKENRELAEFPRVSLDTLEQFPAEFEEYYNDHMPFKNYFVSLSNAIDTIFFQNTKIGDVVIGEDNWLFYLTEREGENAMADYRRTNVYSEEECAEIAGRMEKVRDYLLGERVETFCCYVAPCKETIYPQYMPDKPEVTGDGLSRMESFAAYMEQNSDVQFRYLADDLGRYSRDYQIFCKYDTHMNKIGAFLTSQIMSGDLTGESTDITEVKVIQGDAYNGDLARMIGRETELTDDTEYKIKGYCKGVKYKLVREDSQNGEEIFREYTSNSENDRTLLVVGDSYRLKLEGFLAKRYSRAVFVRIDDFTPEILEEYRPQDVAVITVERDQRYMENLDRYFGIAQ